MFGKKKDEQPTPGTAAAAPTDGDNKSYTKPEAAPSAPSRPAMNPDIARRGPDMSAFAPRPTGGATAAPRAPEAEQKKLIVGRDIFLNGEIRTCDSLVVEGKVEAVLSDCRAMDIAQSGEFKGSAEIESADISGRFDGDLVVRNRLTIRATGKVLGKIRYGQLEVERGGVISGTIEALADGAPVVSGNGR
ncbi:bactofilin family protein [Dongia rigui]|uniref:Polymer-forming cytoskeletal protein n=1 Tax=Dongia rigui TaxID=940149 RepID=A0ABU5DXY1_9PROT|nr:polymer-forming cytoskeletal protein [Dongia rigui]MDY0872130.1 polymer-forming cytoskeletal protein [Dongia rigui]